MSVAHLFPQKVIVFDELETWRTLITSALSGFSVICFDNYDECLTYVHSDPKALALIVGLGVGVGPDMAAVLADRFDKGVVVFLPDREESSLPEPNIIKQKYEPVSPEMFKEKLLRRIK